MVKVFNTGRIIINGKDYIKGISGEILKIVAISKKEFPTVKINIKSFDGETLCDDYLNDTRTRFYPKNTISISQEQVHVENYFISGPLYLNVTGLGEGEEITGILIYYK